MTATVKKDSGWSKEILNLIRKESLTVGIHASDNARGEGPANAVIGHWLEYGTGRIPPRPAFRNTHDENIKEYIKMFGVAVGDAAEKKRSLKAGLRLIGELVANDIKSTIRGRIPPPLAASTVARKGSSTPWIDTGQLIAAINYEVGNDGL